MNTFSSKEVGKIANVATPTLETWVQRGLVACTSRPGTGRSRRWSLKEAIQVAAISELVTLGLRPDIAHFMVKENLTRRRFGSVEVKMNVRHLRERVSEEIAKLSR